MSFAENLRSARKKAGLTQAELANMVYVCSSAVSLWEIKGQEPKLETIKRIASVLHQMLSPVVHYRQYARAAGRG